MGVRDCVWVLCKRRAHSSPLKHRSSPVFNLSESVLVFCVSQFSATTNTWHSLQRKMSVWALVVEVSGLWWAALLWACSMEPCMYIILQVLTFSQKMRKERKKKGLRTHYPTKDMKLLQWPKDLPLGSTSGRSYHFPIAPSRDHVSNSWIFVAVRNSTDWVR